MLKQGCRGETPREQSERAEIYLWLAKSSIELLAMTLTNAGNGLIMRIGTSCSMAAGESIEYKRISARGKEKLGNGNDSDT